MTRTQFVAKAVRAAERTIGIPVGWWGTWGDVRGPKGQRVYLSLGAWNVSINGKRVSRHDSRKFAISKARKS